MALSNLKKSLISRRGGKAPSEIGKINEMENELQDFSDADLKKEGESLRKSAREEKDLNELLPRAFAVVREVSKRTLGQRHYDVQLWGGLVLHKGEIAEMKT